MGENQQGNGVGDDHRVIEELQVHCSVPSFSAANMRDYITSVSPRTIAVRVRDVAGAYSGAGACNNSVNCVVFR
jgi:hypothetical protein